ncbi:8-oxo-dGTP diphosphatase MutT [Arsukibacterium sp.]|uniref:8-oxo-dGTP diphosphatase MutT n=1 Tax=Arsukibacterium sp. TaxID=1977258 RepID=UPI002FDA0AED
MASLAKPQAALADSHAAEHTASAPRQLLQVAVGVILQQQQVLLSLRHPGQHQGNKWEFPGGKVEAAESVEAALHRELQEELAISVTRAEPFMQIEHSYPERDVLLHIWLVRDFSGEPASQEQQPLKWVDISLLHQLNFPDANQPIVSKLQQLATTL